MRAMCPCTSEGLIGCRDCRTWWRGHHSIEAGRLLLGVCSRTPALRPGYRRTARRAATRHSDHIGTQHRSHPDVVPNHPVNPSPWDPLAVRAGNPSGGVHTSSDVDPHVVWFSAFGFAFSSEFFLRRVDSVVAPNRLATRRTPLSRSVWILCEQPIKIWFSKALGHSVFDDADAAWNLAVVSTSRGRKNKTALL